MGKMNGFVGFTLALLIGTSSFAAGVSYQHVPETPWEQEPAEEICLSAESGKGNAICVTLYADQDGYELCVSDEAAWTERCVSSYRLGSPDGYEDDGSTEDRWSLINL